MQTRRRLCEVGYRGAIAEGSTVALINCIIVAAVWQTQAGPIPRRSRGVLAMEESVARFRNCLQLMCDVQGRANPVVDVLQANNDWVRLVLEGPGRCMQPPAAAAAQAVAAGVAQLGYVDLLLPFDIGATRLYGTDAHELPRHDARVPDCDCVAGPNRDRVSSWTPSLST